MKRVLIDTDILSYFFKGDPNVISHFASYLDFFDSIEISLITSFIIVINKNHPTRMAHR